MKSLKIKFVGFWPGFDANDNFIINRIRKNFDVVLSDEPDILFSSVFSDEYLDYDCVRVLYTGENQVPDFNLFDYAIGFEYLDYGDRYLRFPLFALREIYGNDEEAMMHKHENVIERLKNKTDFCSFVVSKGNGYVASEREDIFHKLSEYKKVNSGGRYLNNIGEPDGVADKLLFQTKHKFAIAFENSSHDGYCTEKLMQAFAAGTIPIYWGDPKVKEDFNEAAFINATDYASFDEVVARVKELDNNDEEYLNMLSTPALRDLDCINKYNAKLDRFLQNICNCDGKDAFRRDLVGYNRMHEDALKRTRAYRKTFINRALNKIKLGLR